ncbi:hypothetical protein B0G80_7275 [Paraburkholderia sp. BL6669N2]|nr:hypothetical protein B0G80_7275 [Paraburkholderia sp. BL6669N2]
MRAHGSGMRSRLCVGCVTVTERRLIALASVEFKGYVFVVVLRLLVKEAHAIVHDASLR